MKAKPAVVLTLLCLALPLVGSVALNVALFRKLVADYRDTMQLRLDPTGAGQFEPANRQLPDLEPDQARIVFLGDSRIRQWANLPSLAGAQIVNRGRGGDTTAQVLQRLKRDVVELDPAVAVVQVGINDLKAIGVMADKGGEITKSCCENIQRIAAQLRSAGIHVVVLTVFPAGPVELARRPIWCDAIGKAVVTVNRRIAHMAGDLTTIVDCDPVLSEHGQLKTRFAQDTLHLNEMGYSALNELIGPVLQRLIGRQVCGR